MKVSIITYHDEDNYGATLQAYATYRAVRELGYTPEIINLHMAHREGLLTKILFGVKRWRFNSFRKKYMPNKTRLYTTLEELRKDPPKSDVYLVGSDQTWNPSISKEYALAYFLDFGSNDQKRISYASSFGTSKWVDSSYINKSQAKSCLLKFSNLLIREDKGVELLNREFGITSKQVVDPVLLFPSYPELTGRICPTNDIVVYKIVNDPTFYERAKLLGKEMGCGVHSIGSMRQLKGIRTNYPEPIEKWISNIASAKYVFTDSFHGTVISLLYHRQFVVYVGEVSKISRITSILSIVGLENRICTSDDSLDKIKTLLKTPIDYQKVDAAINKERSLSFELLRTALNSCGYTNTACQDWGGYKRILASIPLVRKLWDIRLHHRDKHELDKRRAYFPQLTKLIDKDTTIITNNCFAGRIMQDLGMQYNSPTLGLYIWYPDYIEFLRNLKYYLTEAKITFVEHSKYPLGDERRAKWSHWYPIGLLDNKVEVAFLHYHTCEEAAEKWYRRAGRINWEKIMIIGMEQNLCTLPDIYAFDELPYNNKIIFTSRSLPTLKSNIHLEMFDGKDEVGDAYRFSDIYYRAMIKHFYDENPCNQYGTN